MVGVQVELVVKHHPKVCKFTTLLIILINNHVKCIFCLRSLSVQSGTNVTRSYKNSFFHLYLFTFESGHKNRR